MPTERRKNPRLGLAIPTRVQGFLADGSIWDEMTTTIDVSSGGACFGLTHEAELGQVLLLTLALPKRLRQHDLTEASYRVYTLVRGGRRRGDQRRVGVMFFGKQPPRGFQERPAARYLLPSDSIVNAPAPQGLRSGDTPYDGLPAVAPNGLAGDLSLDTLVGTGGAPPLPPDDSGSRYTPPPMTAASTIPKGRVAVPRLPLPGATGPEFQATSEVPNDRRTAPRSELFVNFTIQLVDEWGVVLQEELTVADNVSRGGARVMTTLTFHKGDIVLLQEASGGFATRAEVRGISKAQPTIERLHLHFLDRQAPDRLLRQ
jgi:PilZ domain